uniref:Uncharacterized protein n=1 Tax=Pseudo-nitzschia australis TaxID=44445 RepID=A0A7S4EFF1_9STRA
MESKKQHQLPPPPDNSDLMSRLGKFLPQLKSANQELMVLSKANNSSSPTTGVEVLDADLKLDEDSDSDDDDSDNDENLHSKSNPLIQEVETDGVPQNKNANRCETSTANEIANVNAKSNSNASSKAAAPTIQLQFSLGDMSGNPLMKLLAGDDGDDDGDDSSNANSDHDNINIDSEQAVRLQSVANFLKRPTTESSAIKHTHTNGLVTSGETTKGKKRPLVTEIS